MSTKRGHSLIKLRARQTRQKGVGAQCRLPYEALPVRGYWFRDDLMVQRPEAGGRKVRLDLITAREVGIKHSPHRREKLWRDDIIFARSSTNANVTTGAQETPTFSRDRQWIGQVVIDLRHKHEIDRALREWKLVC